VGYGISIIIVSAGNNYECSNSYDYYNRNHYQVVQQYLIPADTLLSLFMLLEKKNFRTRACGPRSLKVTLESSRSLRIYRRKIHLSHFFI
jgi:hypothetical protein